MHRAANATAANAVQLPVNTAKSTLKGAAPIRSQFTVRKRRMTVFLFDSLRRLHPQAASRGQNRSHRRQPRLSPVRGYFFTF
jgi:hypothetical protein